MVIKKVFVTGGSGFVGKSIIKYLKRSFKITASYNNKKPKNNNVKWINLRFGEKKNLKLFEKFDAIIHLATSKSKVGSKKDFLMEKIFLKKICEFCLIKNKPFIFLSSTIIYKNRSKNKESSQIRIKHKNPYINSKINFEKIVRKNFKKGLKALILRVPSVYDNNLNNIKFIEKIKNKLVLNEKVIFHKPTNIKTRFIHVEDISKIIKYSLKLNCYGVYNLESKESFRILDIIKKLKKKIKSKSQIMIVNKKFENLFFPEVSNFKIRRNFKIVPQKKFMSLLIN